MNTIQEIIEIIEPIISKFDPTPILVNENLPLRWESGIFIQDYDFSENHLNLDERYERSNGNYLRSVGSGIEVNIKNDGSFEYHDGAFMIETHTWCGKLNTSADFPSFSLITKEFKDISALQKFLVETYVE